MALKLKQPGDDAEVARLYQRERLKAAVLILVLSATWAAMSIAGMLGR